jgi:hypothetical protein
MTSKGLSEYAGRYRVLEEPGVQIVAGQDQIALRLPGVPPEFDAVLAADEAGGADSFRFAAEPLAGVPVTFARDESGAVSTIDIGGFAQLNRSDDAAKDHDYLFVPEVEPEKTKAEAFEKLWATAVERGDGGLIGYDLSEPKHEFLSYLVEHKPIVLHGSNEPGIDLFEPRRRSTDGAPSGNKQAVYACTDGIWPLYFAIVDRENYQGSLSNGVLQVENEDGQRARLYYFSLSREELGREPGPWTRGTVYILPNATFEQTTVVGVQPLEVASEAPVRPLARLSVSPEDFPCLRDVYGHDGSIDARILELARKLYAECSEARPLEDGYALRYAWSPEWAATAVEYIDLLRPLNPWRRFEIEVEPEGGGVWLTMRGSEALRDVIERELAKAGKGSAEL